MQPSEIASFERLIGKPRLQSYKSYFNAADMETAATLYIWNSELSRCLGTLLAYFEIALRNNVHRALSMHYVGNVGPTAHWWDLIRSQLGGSTMRWVEIVRMGRGVKTRIGAPDADEIVAQVSFGFWTNVLARIDRNKAHVLMPSILPNHPINENVHDWRNDAKRKAALAFVRELNAFRNRLAHHEPLWKFGGIHDTSTNPPTLVLAASTDLVSSQQRFARLLEQYDDAMASLDRSLHADLFKSSWRTTLNFLLSDRGYKRYETRRHVVNTTPAHASVLHRRFFDVVRHNEPVRVKTRDASGIFIPD